MSELENKLQVDMIDEIVDLLVIKGVTDCTTEVVDDLLERLHGEILGGFLIGKYRTANIHINTPSEDLSDDEVLQMIVDKFNSKDK